MYSTPSGYKIGDRIWTTLDELIEDNKIRLVTPCYAVAYEAPVPAAEVPLLQRASKKFEKKEKIVIQQPPPPHAAQRKRPPHLLQRAISAPVMSNEEDAYNEMFPISPTDARVKIMMRESLPSADASLLLHGGLLVNDVDLENFFVPGNYDLMTQPAPMLERAVSAPPVRGYPRRNGTTNQAAAARVAAGLELEEKNVHPD